MNTLSETNKLLTSPKTKVKDLPYFEIKNYPDDALQTRCQPFLDPIVGNEYFQSLISILEKTMEGHQALGLAGPQVGIFYRIVAVKINGQTLTMINPVIKASRGTQEANEACLSFPGLTLKVKRAHSVDVTYMNRQGEWKTETFVDLEAREVQHEIDHLDGKTFLDRIPAFYRRGALQKMQVTQRQQKSAQKKMKAVIAKFKGLQAKQQKNKNGVVAPQEVTGEKAVSTADAIDGV